MHSERVREIESHISDFEADLEVLTFDGEHLGLAGLKVVPPAVRLYADPETHGGRSAFREPPPLDSDVDMATVEGAGKPGTIIYGATNDFFMKFRFHAPTPFENRGKRARGNGSGGETGKGHPG